LSSEARLAVDMLGIQHDVTVEKAVRELGWTPRPLRESVEKAGVLAAGVKRRSLSRTGGGSTQTETTAAAIRRAPRRRSGLSLVELC
jgi:hypothetical protein